MPHRETGDLTRANSSFTLAQARYGRDFVPTREGTESCASVYTFKCTKDSLNYDPLSEAKNRSRKYLSTVFGAVHNVMDAGDGVHLVVRVQCPAGISCDAQAMYFKQIRWMKAIIEKDGLTTAGAVDISWFDRTSLDGLRGRQKQGKFFLVIRTHSASEFEAAKKVFWTSEIAEKIVQFMVSMERRDTNESTTSVKSYTMFVARHEIQQDNCLPRVDADYRCDVANRRYRDLKIFIGRDSVTPHSSHVVFASSRLNLAPRSRNDSTHSLGACRSIKLAKAKCFERPQNSNVSMQTVEGHSWGILRTLVGDIFRVVYATRVPTALSGSNICLHTRIRDYIEDDRVSRRLTSKSLQGYQAQTLSMLDNLGNRIARLHIDAENDYVVRFVLDCICRYDSFDLRLLEIRVFNPLKPHTDPPTLPKGRNPNQLKLYSARPHWTAPNVYSSLTKLVLADLWEKLDLKWQQLHLVLHASVNLEELFLIDVMCAGYTDGPYVVLPLLKRLGLKYRDAGCLYSNGYATLDPIVNYTRHLCAAAGTMRLKMDSEDYDSLKLLFPMFTNASTLDARGCGLTGLIVFTELVRQQALPLPQLQVLKLGGLIHRDQAEMILSGMFTEGLKVKGGQGNDGGVVNSVLRRWDYFEWAINEEGLVTELTVARSIKLDMMRRSPPSENAAYAGVHCFASWTHATTEICSLAMFSALKVLQDVMCVDMHYYGGTPKESWFDVQEKCSDWVTKDNCFYVSYVVIRLTCISNVTHFFLRDPFLQQELVQSSLEPGTVIEVNCRMERSLPGKTLPFVVYGVRFAKSAGLAEEGPWFAL
ncbi:hypothetical protein B0H13DRAFT_1871572 [Mycena leptocephala]|nr:hypothetical protein B0H13DRAFT_1871572 [Mycena leptocephala]